MDHVEEAANYLAKSTLYRPIVGFICGSGLSSLANSLRSSQTVKYEDIPGFPPSTAPDHIGELVFGLLGDVECVCMRGRFHYYEGHSMDQVVLPVRVFRRLGVKLLIITNAAGRLNPSYHIGDVVIVSDHFAMPVMSGQSPLLGAAGPAGSSSSSSAYSSTLQDLAWQAACSLGISSNIQRDGCYCYLPGPYYQTYAETRFLRSAGGDCVGMSTVPEVLAARHTGMEVLALSAVCTNEASCREEESSITHAAVMEAVQASCKHMEAMVKELVQGEGVRCFLAGMQ